MITPRFELKQTDDVVILVIQAPYVRVSMAMNSSESLTIHLKHEKYAIAAEILLQ